MSNDERSGLGLRDVIVALVVLNLVVFLGLPAVEYAREAARNHTCTNNLSRLGVALHAYHDHYNCLPPAAVWGSEGLDLPELFSHKDPTPVHVTRENWVQLLLPYLGEEELASKFDRTVPVVDPRNAAARTFELTAMHCPADTFNRPDNRYQLMLAGGESVSFARGNYAINGGSEYVPTQFGTLSNPGPTENGYHFSEETRAFQWYGNGIAGINKSFALDDIRNGTETMVAIEEVRAGIAPIDPRGVWAFGQIGGSITWGHGVTGDDGGPNFQLETGRADDILGGPTLVEQIGEEVLFNEKMSVCPYCNENFQATARSQHAGGVNVLMMSGAVHFVSDNVEPTLWHVMHARDSPPDIFTDTYAQELKGNYDYGEAVPSDSATEILRDATVDQKAFTNSVGLEFQFVPAGHFEMGVSDKDQFLPFPADAIPHPVTLTQPFYMGVCEVTQQQFQTVMGYNPSGHALEGQFKDVLTISDTSRCPVENVSWDEATKFCQRLSDLPEEKAAGRRYRLPTEAEWEYCCRAGTQGEIAFNKEWDPQDDSGEIAGKMTPPQPVSTMPVGSYPPNAFGMHDMCGNVFEWVADYRAQGYYNRSSERDPPGPAAGYLRVIRGWHWVATGPKCKVYVASPPWVGSPYIGFRVVCETVE
ncbi:Serine/threonine-protein kinase pkn1 [Symmachiella dynata]|uniref:SUMF1/EgtB/PvdO family nonheme iron enzyme n=1 Tax=Symmachiella dynata TaxID=2527995 RepID=UPI00118BE161|nr:SUMF1/EgtB/PvdO family nonheme iron enzyme [Symmachiella dynata]QDT51015.1 Serine/threonine-protein kinase pkn1 [Symmachiella dynata]